MLKNLRRRYIGKQRILWDRLLLILMLCIGLKNTMLYSIKLRNFICGLVNYSTVSGTEYRIAGLFPY